MLLLLLLLLANAVGATAAYSKRPSVQASSRQLARTTATPPRTLSCTLSTQPQGATPEALAPVEERFRSWYANMSRAGLDISMCVDAKAGLVPPTGGGGGSSLTGGGAGLCVLRLSGAADDAALRETSPLILVNDLDLVPVGRGMRGDPPPSQRNPGPGPGPNGRW